MPVRSRPILAAFSLFCSLATACFAWNHVRGSGRVVTEKRDVGAFSAVSVASGIHAEIDQGPAGPIEVSGDDNLLPLLVTQVTGGRLEIGYQRGSSISSSHEVAVHLSAPALTALSASGGATIRAQVARGDSLELTASGGAEIHVSGIDAELVDAEGSGGATLDLEGRASRLELEISGGTRIEASRLDSGAARIRGSGGCEGVVRARDTVRGQLSGGTSIRVVGGARTKVSRSGGSSVDVQD
jgi:Putative auto-transporter adhesin, head GIN domain